MMLLEKCNNGEELKNDIVEMLLLAQDKERIRWLKQVIKYVFTDMLEEDGRKILEVLEKGEMSQMDELIERIKANDEKIRKDLINKGRIEGIVDTIKNMLKQKEDEEKIMKYTNAKKEDIEMAKKELGMY